MDIPTEINVASANKTCLRDSYSLDLSSFKPSEEAGTKYIKIRNGKKPALTALKLKFVAIAAAEITISVRHFMIFDFRKMDIPKPGT